MLDWIMAKPSIRYEAENAVTNGVGDNNGKPLVVVAQSASNGKYLGYLNESSIINFASITNLVGWGIPNIILPTQIE